MRNETIRQNVPKLPLYSNRFYLEGEISRAPCDLHYHDELEFLPVFSGELTCIVDGVRYTAHAGEIIFINSGIPHETVSSTPSRESGIVQFRLQDFTESEIERIVRYSVKYRSFIGTPVRVIRDPLFFSTVTELIDESQGKRKGYEMFVKSTVFRLLGFLYRADYLSDGLELYHRKEVQKILPALSYINENYRDELTLEEISAHLGFNPSYFCRIFKAATGATFKEYLNFVRICKAEKLLAKTQDSILEISSAVGISSLSYFNRIFKKYHNCAPTTFRNAQYTSGM